MKTTFGALLLTCMTTIALADESPVGFYASTLPDTHNGPWQRYQYPRW
ncbi:hypothetical protein QZH45_14510 [Pseudomonas corrugata]|nr:hypothetical protein [Pseudomonas corrugata]UZE08660.1 hypothetical protein LOY65_12335 [Pseudomonas corrugata]